MTIAAAPRMTGLDWLCLLALSALWGGSFFFGKVAVAVVPPLTLVLARVGLAALALLVVVRVAGLRMPSDVRLWLAFAGMGILNNLIPFGLIFYGQTTIGAGLAAVINGMTPFWAALLARAVGAEPLTFGKLAGIAIGFGGLAVMIGPAALGGLDTSLIAQLAVVGATISYGCASVFGRRFKALPPLVTATGQLSASSLLVLPLALLIDRPWTLDIPEPAVLGAIVALALFSTSLAYILFFRVLANAGATNVSLVTLLVPVSAMLLGVLILDEAVTDRQLLGLALIALGMAFIDGRLLARLRLATG
ncbi:ABC transporter, membrane spanning protein [alpha proteobacterium BAL199]|jgi:drug/metabolite transporter (DMT)-like permease|nr:ABC transporter, membrane spanning protein [alpha proteobacterium BAL199]